MPRIPSQFAAATSTTGRCVAFVPGCVRAWVKRHRTQDGSPLVRSSNVPLRTGCSSKTTQRRPPDSRRAELSGPVVAPDTLLVDIAPKVAVVIGVGNGDLFTGLLHGNARQI